MNKTLRTALRNLLGIHHCPEYIKIVRELYPNAHHIHHILGSVRGKKKPLNDFLVVPLTASEHEKRHYSKDAYDYFFEDFIESLKILIKVVKYLLGEK